MAALERSGLRHVGVVHASDYRFMSDLARPAADYGIPESVDREPGLPFLDAGAPQDVLIGGACLPQRSRGKVTVDDHLGVPQRHMAAAWPFHRYRQPSDQVLPEVKQIRSIVAEKSRHGSDAVGAPDRRALRWGKGGRVSLVHLDRRPSSAARAIGL